MASVALIVKLDDIGLHLAERAQRAARERSATAWSTSCPKLLTALSAIGTAAMLWVGGGILLHGLEELHVLDGHSAHGPRLRASAGAAGGLAVRRRRMAGRRARRRDRRA